MGREVASIIYAANIFEPPPRAKSYANWNFVIWIELLYLSTWSKEPEAWL